MQNTLISASSLSKTKWLILLMYKSSLTWLPIHAEEIWDCAWNLLKWNASSSALHIVSSFVISHSLCAPTNISPCCENTHSIHLITCYNNFSFVSNVIQLCIRALKHEGYVIQLMEMKDFPSIIFSLLWCNNFKNIRQSCNHEKKFQQAVFLFLSKSRSQFPEIKV